MSLLKKLTITVAMLLFLGLNFNICIFAQRPADNFVRRVHYFAGDSIQYRLFIPNDSTNSNLYPLILTAHGSGEIGDDNNSQIIHNRIAEAWAEDSVQNKYPSFICSPQFPDRPNFDDFLQNIYNPSINSMLDSLINEFSIDTNRIYMTGLSFGAFGTWDFIYKTMPNRFAAVIPLAGAWPWEDVPIVTDVPFWAFCGVFDELLDDVRQTISFVEAAGYEIEKRYTKYGSRFSDDPVDVGLTIDEIDLLNQNEKKHIYTEFTDGGHDIFSKTYDDPALHYWLFSQQRDTNGNKINAQVISWEAFPKYIPQEGDTIKINSEILNPENHIFEVKTYIEGIQSSFRDSLQLYDDGLHDDGSPSDNIWGNFIPLSNLEEDFFDISIRATDLTEPRNISSADKAQFITAGPVVWKDYVIKQQNDSAYTMKVTLENLSSSFTFSDISALLSTIDSNVTEILSAGYNPQYYPDIEPGQSVQSTGTYGYGFYAKNNPETVEFVLDIRRDNITYWTDTIMVLVTDIEDELKNLPKEFSLEQNYPNPFNPSTTIKYSIPKQTNVTLKVFDVLGSEVATLVKKVQTQGNYELEFDGADLTSGIYFYSLQAGDYVETRKMILLK